MRLFNFEISHSQFTNQSMTSDQISVAFSEHRSHATNPIIVGAFSLTDNGDQTGSSSTEPQGQYQFSQDSDSLDKSLTESATLVGSLTALPVNIDGSDSITADVIVVSNANFGG